MNTRPDQQSALSPAERRASSAVAGASDNLARRMITCIRRGSQNHALAASKDRRRCRDLPARCAEPLARARSAGLAARGDGRQAAWGMAARAIWSTNSPVICLVATFTRL